MLIHVWPHTVIEQRLHFYLLFAVVFDRGCIQSGPVTAALAHLPCRLDVIERVVKQLAGDTHNFLELLLIGGIHRPLQRVQAGLHAFFDCLGECH